MINQQAIQDLPILIKKLKAKLGILEKDKRFLKVIALIVNVKKFIKKLRNAAARTRLKKERLEQGLEEEPEKPKEKMTLKEQYLAKIQEALIKKIHENAKLLSRKRGKKKKDKDEIPSYNNKYAPIEYLRVMHRTKETRMLSDMSLSNLWDCAKMQVLTPLEEEEREREFMLKIALMYKDKLEQEGKLPVTPARQTEADEPNPTPTPSVRREDQGPRVFEMHERPVIPISDMLDKVDFFMVLQGQCYLCLDVRITYDSSHKTIFFIKEPVKMLDYKQLLPTSSSEDSQRDKKEPESFKAKFLLSTMCVINESNIKNFHLDFKQYFRELRQKKKEEA